MSMRDRDGLARRDGWSSASSDRRVERRVKRVKGRARKGVGASNGEHVHITLSMALTMFVRFGVEVEGIVGACRRKMVVG